MPLFAKTARALLANAQTFSAVKFGAKYHARVGHGVRKRYNKMLAQESQSVFLTYIWIDGTGERTRSKMKVVNEEPDRIEDVAKWHYDGSSTYQATGEHSDMVLHPAFMCRDPFFGARHRLILCEVKDRHGKPARAFSI